jgi:hypothetical protein
VKSKATPDGTKTLIDPKPRRTKNIYTSRKI